MKTAQAFIIGSLKIWLSPVPYSQFASATSSARKAVTIPPSLLAKLKEAEENMGYTYAESRANIKEIGDAWAEWENEQGSQRSDAAVGICLKAVQANKTIPANERNEQMLAIGDISPLSDVVAGRYVFSIMAGEDSLEKVVKVWTEMREWANGASSIISEEIIANKQEDFK